jgi:molybdopterin synthase catalytic subunit
VDKQIQVRVLTFASLRQIMGMSSLTVDLASGATVADLMERLSKDFPTAAPHLVRAIVAVNQDYAARTRTLIPNDEVAIFPPVSGGAPNMIDGEEATTFVDLSDGPIDLLQVSSLVTEPSIGSVVTFAGVVRDNNLGRQVHYLEYEAYPEMAKAKMHEIVAEARERWPLIRGVAVVHRTGHLEIGDMAVLVAVGSPHRGDGGFEAARYIIDRTKEIVPIWKKEVWTDGEEWLEGEYHPEPND